MEALGKQKQNKTKNKTTTQTADGAFSINVMLSHSHIQTSHIRQSTKERNKGIVFAIVSVRTVWTDFDELQAHYYYFCLT
mmetsp:Transcript_69347/g.80949  ORF Transcript_69347/g.80949 Transcript_69347/m.80949 type:complete len:80 (+) Transcript_69347:1435-1674(+)